MLKFSQHLSESLSKRPTLEVCYFRHGDPERGAVYSFVANNAVYQLLVDRSRSRLDDSAMKFVINFGLVEDLDTKLTQVQFALRYGNPKMLRYSETSYGTPFAVMSGIISGIEQCLKMYRASAGDKVIFTGNSSDKHRMYVAIANRFVKRGLLRVEKGPWNQDVYTLAKNYDEI